MISLWGYQWDLPKQQISLWHANRFSQGNVVLCGKKVPATHWTQKWKEVTHDYMTTEICKQCTNCIRRLQNVGKK